MTNPLIAKYEELYGKKEEPKAEIVKLSQEQSDILNKYLQNTNFPYAPPQSVATSNTGITAVNPSRTFTSYDRNSGEDSFLQIAEKVKNGEAKVSYMSMNRDIMSGTSITFEVQMWDTP